MVSAEEVAEIDRHFKQRLEYSKLRWAARGRDARIAAYQARIAKPSWRQLTGIQFFMHEAAHPGNRPFAWGFATIFVFSLWAQTKFSGEMKANSLYYQEYHAKDKKH